MKSAQPTIEELELHRVRGRMISEAALGRDYRGAASIEQEYICEKDVFTVHWIERDGRVLHGPHVRPGKPKGLAS